jgi:8-oxo-dGTP pyrophosphatase MutT (NUDIX family)
MPHIHKDYDFTISAYIVYKSKVLLTNHPRYNKWIPMGGHVELNEDPDQTLVREIKEETGLDVEILNTKPEVDDLKIKFLYTPSFIEVHEANPPHKHICLVYYARAKNDKHVLSDEHTAIEWLGEDDLDNPKYNLSESVKFGVREALKAEARY